MRIRGIFASVLALTFCIACSFGATLYVDINSTNPVPPYNSWATASTNIQITIDASTNGDTVLVTNGIYSTGGKSMDGVISNRVAIYKRITVSSINGPKSTAIKGAFAPIFMTGTNSMRCVWMTNNAVLSGFTLLDGTTMLGVLAGSSTTGGGVYGLATSALVTNCILSGNTAQINGGGAYSVTLNKCTLVNNQVRVAGSGAGASSCNLIGCYVLGNRAYNGDSGGLSSVMQQIVPWLAITRSRPEEPPPAAPWSTAR